MAYLTNTACQECGDIFMGDYFSGNKTCSKCLTATADKKKAQHFAELDKLTFEERLRKLEEISYNRSIAKPVYVAPPKY